MLFRSGDKLNKVLGDIAEKLGRASTLKVGFLEGATYPDGTLVAMVAAIQNFGAPAAGIPPRPFFSNMVAEKSPEWGDKLAAILERADYDGKLALNRLGYGIASDLQMSIIETNDPALDPATIASKGFSKPLVDTGQMLNSVQYDVDGKSRNLPYVGQKRAKGAK